MALEFLFNPIVAGIGGAVLFVGLVLLLWYMSSNSSMERGTRDERRAIRRLGNRFVFLLGYLTGRALLRKLRAGIKDSKKLEKSSGNFRGNEQITGDFAEYEKKSIKEERENIEVELHETAAGAASLNVAEVIERLTNEELRVEQTEQKVETQLVSLDQQLAQAKNVEDIDRQARPFVVQTGEQITSALITLAHSEEFELHVRRKSFNEVYRLLKIIKIAEGLALKIERRAIRNEKQLSKFNEREIRDLEAYLKDRIKQENQRIRAARAAYNNSKSTDRATKVALYNQIRAAQETAERVKANIARLEAILLQLKRLNWRMLGALRKIKRDIRKVLDLVALALLKEDKLKAMESGIDKKASGIKLASKTAESHLKLIREQFAEQIIIELTGDSGAILSNIIEISREVIKVDQISLVPLMEALRNAMNDAYHVEESSRIANSFYVRLMQANEKFYELVVEGDFSQPIKDSFTKQIQIEKMEEQIASSELNTAQVAKSLFIRTLNEIQNALGRILQHIQYLENNTQLLGQTRDYTLNTLSDLMAKINQHKIRVDDNLAAKAEAYQVDLEKAKSRQTVERLAA